MMLVDHLLALLGSESKEGEHTDLGSNMIPVTLGSVLNESGLKS